MSITLMVCDRQINEFQVIRQWVFVLVSPLQFVVHAPIQAIDNVKKYFISKNSAISKINDLSEERIQLLAKIQKLHDLEAENAQLRELLKSSAKMKFNSFAARVVRVNTTPFSHQILIDKGKKDGVFIGQTVIDAFGLFGTIVDVGYLSSRILVLTDPSHAIPVQNVRNGERAIASGTGNVGNLSLLHVPETSDYEVGDVLVTSGLGDKFPKGYPVGEIIEKKVVAGQDFLKILIKPAANPTRSRQVLLIDTRRNR